MAIRFFNKDCSEGRKHELSTFMQAMLCMLILLAPLPVTVALANTQTSGGITCAESKSPYRDLDFLVGEWEFFTMEGKKIADQHYRKKEQGCLIQEDWRTLSGQTGTGMNFVDPATGKWRQVWMSPRFHIDYSGGITETGDLVLEGRMYPNNGAPASAIRGIYSRQPDGSITKEFLKRNDATASWQRFFIGVARKKQNVPEMAGVD